MSELITTEIFTDGQKNINAANMNGIIGNAKVQPDIIAAKPASATMDVADMFLVLKTDNTLAKSRFDTIVNSTSSTLPLADTTKNGMLRQVSGNASDFVDGTNNCQPISNIIPAGTIWEFASDGIPAGWLLCDGASYPAATYPNLFAILGNYYGGSGGNFNVPDCRGRVTVGSGHGSGLTNRIIGNVGGEETHLLSIAEIPSHTHEVYYKNNAAGGTGANGLWNSGAPTGTLTSAAAGSGAAHNIMPPYMVFNKIIKF